MNASTAPATLEQAQEMGLTPDEFQKIQEILHNFHRNLQLQPQFACVSPVAFVD